MANRWLARPAFGILLSVVVALSASGQAGPPCGPNLPIKCASAGKQVAIVAGLVGVVVLVFYAQHRMNSRDRKDTVLAGCTAQAGGVMTLTDDNTKTTYSLASLPKKLKTGRQVALRGIKSQDASGKNVFQVRKLVKDKGPCGSQAPTAGAGNSP